MGPTFPTISINSGPTFLQFLAKDGGGGVAPLPPYTPLMCAPEGNHKNVIYGVAIYKFSIVISYFFEGFVFSL